MKKNSSVVCFRQPDAIDDPLTSILRSGVRQLLTRAVEMEAEEFIAAMLSRWATSRVGRGGHPGQRIATMPTGPRPVRSWPRARDSSNQET